MITRTVSVNPIAADMPSPALRLWIYMIQNPIFTGTPSILRDGIKSSTNETACQVSRRALPIALDWLERSGMVNVHRRGSYLEVRLIQGQESGT